MLATALGLAWLFLAPACLWTLIRGGTAHRVAAVLTLVLLEAGTIALDASSSPGGPVVARGTPQELRCSPRTPAPETARLSGDRDSLTLTWAAAYGECGSASVVMRPKGRKLKIWVNEGPSRTGHAKAVTVPVLVASGTASLRLDLPGRKRYLPVDGRTGKFIPAASPAPRPTRTSGRTRHRTR
jgi:hypothetical protein